MAMKTCKDCGTEISKSATVCLNCGKKQKNQTLRIILGILLVIMGIGIIASSGEDANTNITNSLVGESIISKVNYDKIQEGMNEEEVKGILGESTSVSESYTPGIGTMVLKHYQEPLTLKAIDIYFLDGKVYMKNWTEL